jgi:hypothetical protein
MSVIGLAAASKQQNCHVGIERFRDTDQKLFRRRNCYQYGTHHSYVLVVHTLRVAVNEILKLDLPAKRH